MVLMRGDNMTYDEMQSKLQSVAEEVLRHDKEEGICCNMCEGLCLSKIDAELVKSNQRQEAVELLKKAGVLIRKAW